MIKEIEDFIQNTTMYRLIELYLAALIVIAVILGFFGLININPWLLILFTLFISVSSYVTNAVLQEIFNVPINKESFLISAFILALIITPVMSFSIVMFAFWASVWSMASKFIFTINKKHIFNPVAIALVITGVFLKITPSWWVGTFFMLPFVVIGGYFIVKKIRRFDLVISFISSTLLITFIYSIITKQSLLFAAQTSIVASPILFFSTVMLTEPLTTPPSSRKRIIYGVITGIVFNPLFQIGSIYSTPELALCVGNIYSYLVSPKEKLLLTLKRKEKISNDSYDFIFENTPKLNFNAGQYMEWTLPNENSDDRGNRRYFTLASSPTENELRVGIKFNDNPSTYKKQLLEMDDSSTIVASSLSGDFILPENKDEKLVFIAGGIGITPFRSMIKYLIDTKEKRDIVLIYSCRKKEDFVYQKIFEQAKEHFGLKVFYAISNTQSVPSDWTGLVGYVDEKMLKECVPDFNERMFYLSGPQKLVTSFKDKLTQMGVDRFSIMTDYFPGFN